MMQRWSFSDLEFKVLWEHFSELPLPAPFTYTCRIPLQDDDEREQERIWEQLSGKVDGDLIRAIETVCHPDVFVAARGWCDSDMDNPEKQVRIGGAMAGTRGYALTQLPGKTVWHSGGYTIEECGPCEVATTVVALMPAVAAGRLENIPVPTEPLEPDPARLTFDDQYSQAARSRRFLQIPATTTGWITVRQGRSEFGQRGILEQTMQWRDLPDDGRYVIAPDAAVAIATGARRLVGLIDDAIEMMVYRLETIGNQEK